jgi:hypothetical protein
MPPAQAASLLIVPSFMTNIWQLLAGTSFGPLLRRLWPMMVGIALETLAGAGFMQGESAGRAAVALGALLVTYAVVGLSSIRGLSDRHRSLRHGASLGARADEAGPPGAAHAAELRETLRQMTEERRRFRMRRLRNVATELSLHVLAYNLKRVIAIIGTRSLIAALRA